jgi:signal transduction histidine kinase
MNNIKTKYISCPNCGQLVTAVSQQCPNCESDLAIAAVIAERALTTAPLFPIFTPSSPEMLVPRLGEYLIDQGYITNEMLGDALQIQKQLARRGEKRLTGELLIELGHISHDTLNQAITQHVLQLQAALTYSNQRLEQQVQERTSQLQNALMKLSELNQLKRNFISNVSHELRMPMQFLIGYMDLFQSGNLGSLSDEQSAALTSMLTAGTQLKGLIENLLQFSKAATAEIPLDLTPLTLDLPVKTAVSHSINKAQHRNLILKKSLASHLPTVIADNEKITWVVEQFLDNAIKFTPSGGKIKVTTAPLDGDVIVRVTDSGPGIPQSRIAEIFEPFHQLDGSATRHHGGTGLGLALARSIVEAHGSTIQVDSYVGQGSRFSFSLPAFN